MESDQKTTDPRCTGVDEKKSCDVADKSDEVNGKQEEDVEEKSGSSSDSVDSKLKYLFIRCLLETLYGLTLNNLRSNSP